MQGYNNDAKEFGSEAEEIRGSDEGRSVSDGTPIKETQTQPEGNSQKESGDAKRKSFADRGREKRRAQNLARAISSVLTASVATVTLVGIVPNVRDMLVKPDYANVEAVEIATDSDDLYYELKVAGDDLDVVLYNDFVSRRQDLTEGINEGVFENLKLGVKYKLAVVSGNGLTEREIASWDVKIKAHPIEASVAKIEAARAELNSVNCSISSQSEIPLKAVLIGNDFRDERALQNGDTQIVFENLTQDTKFTLLIVGEGANGETAIASQELYTLHPADYTTVQIYDIANDGGATYYSIQASGTVDIQDVGLVVCCYTSDGRLVSRVPYDPTEGGMLDEPTDPKNVEVFGALENLDEGGHYTISVEASTARGVLTLATQSFRAAHPIDSLFVDIPEIALDEAGLHYMVEASGSVPLSEFELTVTLLGADGSRIASVLFDPTSGGMTDGSLDNTEGVMTATFTGTTEWESYTIIVEGRGPDGIELLASASPQ